MARRRKVATKVEQEVLADNVLRFINGWPPGVVEVRVVSMHCTGCSRFYFVTDPDTPHVCKTPDVAGFFKELDTLDPHDQEAVLLEAAEYARSKR